MEISDEPGYIDFHNLTLHTNQISNIKRIRDENPKFEIYASTNFLNKTPLRANFFFDLTDKNYSHTVSGSMGPIALKELNVMIEKVAPLSVESGQLDRFDFDISFRKERATGELYFAYHDFQISVLNLDYRGSKKSKLASFWANKMMLNSNNPKGDKFEPVTISYERDIQRSIINYWWKAIFTGSKETLGIKNGEKKK